MSAKYLFALILSLQYEFLSNLNIKHKITGFAKSTDMGGNGEFSTQKVDVGGNGEFSKKNPYVDWYGSGRTGWSGVGLEILSREGL